MFLFPDSNSNMDAFALAPVAPQHTRTEGGVCFNVQTVDKLGVPLHRQDQAATTASLTASATNFYLRKELGSADGPAAHAVGRPRRPTNRHSAAPRLEAHSVPPNTLVVHPAKSLAHIALTAFAKHYPLVLRPDDVWLALAYGAAKHVDKNAEALRSRFVSFKGKKTLEVRNDSLVMGSVPEHLWERDVFAQFSSQIREHIGYETHALFAGQFSTTSKADHAASEITLMAATANYFSLMMTTLCGIPSIELKGTLEDWTSLRDRAEKLRNVLLPEFADQWLPNLLPVLDEFVQAYKGNVNHEFWQRMVKKVETAGSGRSAYLSGWIVNLYPYLASGDLNPHIKPWREMTPEFGPEPEDIPELLSSVKVVWNYLGTDFPLHFHAGCMGTTQDQQTQALSPHIGWIVSHDP